MTPADIEKVREALDGLLHATTLSEQYEDEIDAERAKGLEALSILAAEAKRKTRTHFRIERKDTIGWYAHGGFFGTRERAEEVGRGMRMDFRILEVTESWEEPQS